MKTSQNTMLHAQVAWQLHFVFYINFLKAASSLCMIDKKSSLMIPRQFVPEFCKQYLVKRKGKSSNSLSLNHSVIY